MIKHTCTCARRNARTHARTQLGGAGSQVYGEDACTSCGWHLLDVNGDDLTAENVVCVLLYTAAQEARCQLLHTFKVCKCRAAATEEFAETVQTVLTVSLGMQQLPQDDLVCLNRAVPWQPPHAQRGFAPAGRRAPREA